MTLISDEMIFPIPPRTIDRAIAHDNTTSHRIISPVIAVIEIYLPNVRNINNVLFGGQTRGH
jgi:hypothetical protein